MLFYENDHSKKREYMLMHRNTDMCFPNHLHRSFEFIFVHSGTLELSIGTKIYILQAGQAALIFPCQVHAYHTKEHSGSQLCIFSEDLVPDFCLLIRGKRVESPVFPLEPEEVSRLLDSCRASSFAMKATLYRIAHLFVSHCPLLPAEHADDPALLERIIDYVQAHFLEKLTLNDLAQTLGYHYNYLSGYISQHLGLHFCAFVNLYRADYACELLQQPELSISTVAQQCGFETIRSFNRNFLRFQGCTPQAYRSRTISQQGVTL